MSINTTFQETKYQLNIKVCSPNPNVREFYEKFSYHHQGDSGIDLYSFNDLCIRPFNVGTIDFEIQCEMIDLTNNTYTSYYLVPRSSISNTDFQLANSIGIIDASYRGNLKAKVRCFNPINASTLPKGSYFQIIAPDMKPIKVCLVESLSDTTRKDGGFGSTNK